jgi:hypothetical protein
MCNVNKSMKLQLIPLKNLEAIALKDFSSKKKDFISFKARDTFKVLGITPDNKIMYVANYYQTPFTRNKDSKIGYVYKKFFSLRSNTIDHNVTPQYLSIKKIIYDNIHKGRYPVSEIKKMDFLTQKELAYALEIKKNIKTRLPSIKLKKTIVLSLSLPLSKRKNGVTKK